MALCQRNTKKGTREMNKLEMFMDALMPAIPAIGILIVLVWVSLYI